MLFVRRGAVIAVLVKGRWHGKAVTEGLAILNIYAANPPAENVKAFFVFPFFLTSWAR